MDSRNAWRFLDFVKDFFMHHRKFTPFQKVVFVSFSVGVLFIVMHNFWALGLTFTYVGSLYLSVKASSYISTRNYVFPSHLALIWTEKLDSVIRPLISSIFVQRYKHTQQTEHINRSDNQKDSEKETVELAHTSVGGPHVKDVDNKAIHRQADIHHVSSVKISGRRVTDLKLENEKLDKRIEGLESDEKQVYMELSRLLRLIKRDFIESWYSLFSNDKKGLQDAEEMLYHICDNLQYRVSRETCLDVIQCIIKMYRNHVRVLKQSKLMYRAMRRRKMQKSASKSEPGSPSLKVYSSVEDCYASKVELHPATKDSDSERMYLKAVTEFLLMHLLPEDVTGTKTVTCALKEILMFNVAQSIFSLLCETSFLHECIIKVTSDEAPGICPESKPVIIVTETNIPCSEVQSILVEKASTMEKSKSTEVFSSSQAVDLTVSESNVTSTEPEEERQAESSATAGTKNSKRSSTNGTRDLESLATGGTKDTKRSSTDGTKHSESSATAGIKDTLIPCEAKWKEDTVLHPVRKGLCHECNRLSSRDKDKISPRPHTCALGSSPVFFDKVSDSDALSQCSISSSFEEKPVFTVQGDIDETIVSSESNIPPGSNQSAKTTHTNHYLETVSELHGCTEATELEDKSEPESEGKPVTSLFPFTFPNPFNSLSRPSFLDRKRSSTSLHSDGEEAASDGTTLDIPKSHSTGEVTLERASPTTPSDGLPPSPGTMSVFQDIRIIATELAKEPGRETNYTLYVVEYEGWYPSEDSEQLVLKTGSVKRRYSEFVNLQARLEDNSSYRRSLKDVKRPKKLMPPLPFGNMGREAVENRKNLLDQFLKDIIKKVDLCNGEELKMFLGYSGDGHLAFVRKLPEQVGQGINQRLVKTMSGVFDNLMDSIQSIPNIPQQLPRLLSDLRNDKDAEKPSLSDLDHMDIDFVFEDQSDHGSQFEVGLDKFLSEGDVSLGISILGWQDQNNQGLTSLTSDCHVQGTSPLLQKQDTKGVVWSRQQATVQDTKVKDMKHSNERVSGDSPGGTTAGSLTDSVLDTLTELLQGQDNWLCRDTVMHTTKVLFGSGLHRFLKMKLESLLTREMCTFYLSTLRTTFWPGDTLSEDSRPVLNDHEREIRKKQAARCLAEFLPGLLKPLLGDDDFNILIQEALGSLEYKKLNRHFWYTVLDIILERMFPEITSPDRQRKFSECPEVH